MPGTSGNDTAPLKTFKGHSERVLQLVISPDANLLASVSEDQTVKLWDIAEGYSHRQLDYPRATDPIAFSRDGKVLATSSLDGAVMLWYPATGRLLRTFKLPEHGERKITAMAFSPVGNKLAWAFNDGMVSLWDEDKEASREVDRVPLWTCKVHGNWVGKVVFSLDGSMVASASRDRTVVVCGADNGEQKWTKNDCSDRGTAVAFSPNCRWVACTNGTTYNRVHRQWEVVVKLWHIFGEEPERTIGERACDIKDIAFSPDGNMLASLHDNPDEIRLFETDAGRHQHTFTFGQPIATLSISDGGRQIETGRGKVYSSCRLSKCRSTRHRAHLSGPFVQQGGIKFGGKLVHRISNSLAWDVRDNFVALGTGRGQITIWRAGGPLAEPVEPAARAEEAEAVEERPVRSWRNNDLGEYETIRNRAMTQRMFVINRVREGNAETMTIAGTTGNLYTITINERPSCNCPQGKLNNQCKHIVYAMCRVLHVPYHLQQQHKLLPDDLRSIFANAPPIPSADTSTIASKRKPITPESDCPICCMPFEPETEDIIYCKAVCGNNVHRECFNKWRETLIAGNENAIVRCIFCRVPWQEDEDEDEVEMLVNGGSLNKEGYYNIGGKLGLPKHRDPSTYRRRRPYSHRAG